MKRWILLAGVVAALAAGIYTTTATAAPIPGAHYSRYTLDYTDYLAIYVKGSYVDGLTSLGCPFTPHEASIEFLDTVSSRSAKT